MDPFFIVGVSRSGTTFLHHLLNTHPQFRLSYEGRLFTEGWQCYRRYDDLANRNQFDSLLADLIACDRSESLNRWLGPNMTDTKDFLFEQHQQYPSFPSLIEQIYQLPSPVGVWGNKMLRIEMAPDILRHWPHAKFVALVRDPRAVYASQKRFFPDRRLKYSGIYWNIHTGAIADHELPEEQVMVLRYEDFVEDARTHLERILKFAGCWDEATAEQMLECHPASPASIGKWRADLSDREIQTIEEICFDRMQQFGYPPELAKKSVRLGTLTKAVETVLDNKARIPRSLAEWKNKNVLKRFWLTVRR